MNNPLRINRRDFLAAGILTGIASGLEGQVLQALQAPAGAAPQEWFDKPMRWMQLVLVENDPGQYDPKFWIDLFKQAHVDAVCLSAGGCVAYYPTAIPLHHRSTSMKDGTDPFGELVAECRKLGMIVIARTDPHSVLDDAAAAHPEWIAVDAQGNKRRHWAAPNRWVTCALGPYNFQFMTDVTKEIVTKYNVEGVFANRWQGSGMCYCDSCKQLFRAFCGMELPRASDPQNAAYRKYIEWSSARLFELWRLWDGEIRKINPQARYIANSGGGSGTTLDMVTISQLAPTLFADRQSRRGLMTPWAIGKNGKEFRATFGRKAIVGITSLGFDDDHRWKDSVNSDAEIGIWLASGVANGLRPWIAKFSGTVYDKRWVPGVQKFYDWHFRNEKYLRNETNLARVAMVYSQQTGTFYGGTRKRERVEDHENGMYQALIEARMPFELAHDKLLDADSIDRYKLLILPNIAALSDAQCEQIRAYVKRGGSVLATFETSLYDEWGKRRDNFGLADLFGVDFAGRVETDVKNSYMRIDAQTRHPILRGLEDAGRIINTVQRVSVKLNRALASNPATQIPSYPDLPMEEVYPRTLQTDVPEVCLSQIGAGRVVYFPGDIDRSFWETMCVDHAVLLRNCVEWALNEEKPVTVEGPGVLDVTCWRQKNSMTVHLVNLTNPMMLKGPYREFLHSGEQKLRIRLPEGDTVKAVRLLVAGTTPAVSQNGGVVSVTVPTILDREVIAIDL